MRTFLTCAVVCLSLLGFSQVPSTQSSSIVFNNTYCNRTDLSWTVGDGNGRIVIARKGQPVTASPTNNTYYIARDTFGDAASEISAGQFVVYNGDENSLIVYGLESNTVYHFAVFEYNGSGSIFSYLTTNEPQDSVLTEWLLADFSIDNPHQCEDGNLFSFTEGVTQSASATINYTWTFGDGALSYDADPTYSYSNYGIYDVGLTARTTGCAHTIVKKDTVVPLPIVNFVLNADSPNNTRTQCFFKADGSVNRFAFKNMSQYPFLPGGGFDVNEVRWDFGDGTSSVQNHVRKKSYAEPGSYTVKLVVRTSKNNGVHFCADSFSMNVEVKPRPLDSTMIFFSDTSMCLNNNLFTFENGTGIAGTGWWFFGDGDSAQGDLVNHHYTSPGDYLVLFEFIDTAGCYDMYDDSVEVVPQPNNYFSGLSSYFCQGDPPVSLDPNLIGGTFEGDGVSNNDQSFTPSMLGLNTIRYIYQINNCIDTTEQSIWVMPVPVFSLGTDTSICIGDSLLLSAAADSSSFQWSNGANGTTNSIYARTDGIYWAEKDNGWCSYRDSIEVSVIDPPVVDLGSDTVLCGGNYRIVDVTADEGVYTWDDGYIGPYREITESGTYVVTVTNKCGSAQDEVELTILPYACELFIPTAFSPNNDGWNDEFRLIGQVTVTHMVIFNRWGEVLADIPGPDPSWDGTFMGERVQTGIYFFDVYFDDPQGDQLVPQRESGNVYVVY